MTKGRFAKMDYYAARPAHKLGPKRKQERTASEKLEILNEIHKTYIGSELVPGLPKLEAIAQHNITYDTYYRWKKELLSENLG